MIVLGYGTAPFVNSILLRLPQTARRSRDAMIRYVQNLPKDAELEIVTARLLGFKKTNSVRLSEMHVLPPRRFGFANLEHVVPAWQRKIEAERPLWKKVGSLLGETRNKFYVKGDKASSKRSRAPGVWELVFKQIQQNGRGK
ncbi:hypothetical protein BU16DRAFT_211265 [Lophium mytilinum]|uniref:Uncharacterized protein n=1 Tax=Lophium mytilinum TaxID=390894 RepID=A0A6A6RDQ4_9PEZI|nr:hypothetical protein BU16DRAFT_211265 [Lophium mytilinum]